MRISRRAWSVMSSWASSARNVSGRSRVPVAVSAGSGAGPVQPWASRTAFRFYDLRHTGHTLSTRSGATLKDTMVRAGQSSEEAALIYQHSDEERQRDVAAGLDDMVRAERAKHRDDDPAHHREKPTGTWSSPYGADVVRAPLTGLDNKEPPGHRPGGFAWSG